MGHREQPIRVGVGDNRDREASRNLAGILVQEVDHRVGQQNRVPFVTAMQAANQQRRDRAVAKALRHNRSALNG